MAQRSTAANIATGATLLALTACSQNGSNYAGPANSSAAASNRAAAPRGWIANGATACDKHLTPDVVAAILSHPTGKSRRLSDQACRFESNDSGGSISITLANAGPAAFDQYQQYLVYPRPLAGVGDKASSSLTGIDAVKGNDRTCTIDAGGAPGSTKLTGDALAQKLGEICNRLFALP